MDKSSLNKLKKRLFVLAGYALVTGLLFVYVSYSQYKMSMYARVRMPESLTLQAGLALSGTGTPTENTSGGAVQTADRGLHAVADVSIDGFMDTLVPGNKAATYADASSTESITNNHKLVVSVNNIAEPEVKDADGNVVTSAKALDIGLEYTLTVKTDGMLPLEFVLKGDDGNYYKGRSVHNGTEQAIKLTKVGADPNGEPDGTTEAKFIIPGGVPETKDHFIYVGWNNQDENGTDIALCKELDRIVIQAHITGLPQERGEGSTAPQVKLQYVYEDTDK